MPTDLVEQQAEALQQQFSHSNKMIGEIRRNRMGNVVWPFAERLCGMLMFGVVALVSAKLARGMPISGDPWMAAGVLTMCAVGLNWAHGHIKYLQNLTLSNASVFGRAMRNEKIPQNIRARAVELFLKKESPWFTANSYIKQKPDEINRLSDGRLATKNTNFISIFEEKGNKLAKRGNVTLADKIKLYKESIQEWRAIRKKEKATKSEGNLQIATQRVSLNSLQKSLAEEIASPSRTDVARDNRIATNTPSRTTEQKADVIRHNLSSGR